MKFKKTKSTKPINPNFKIQKQIQVQNDIMRFLNESNKIEGVDDPVSLSDARRAWEYLLDKELTIKNILHAHKILMESQGIEDKYKGKFRDVPVYIGGREAYPPEIVPSAMQRWYQESVQGWQLQIKHWSEIRKAHIHFEAIHPFIDGNGRIGRIIMNWQRLKNGYPVEIIYDKNKHQYYRWFEEIYD